MSGRPRAARELASITLCGVLPALVSGWTLLRVGRDVPLGGDFHYAFWPAGKRVLHGLSPYVDPGSSTIAHAVAFVYPALAALLLAPLSLLPHTVADNVFALLNLGAALLTLRVLRVRDWRLYGLITLCPAVVSGWTLANVTLLLGLGVALIWRYRERAMLTGLLLAVLVSVKLFLWPLGLWLLATRRYAALGYAMVCGLVLNLISWTVLGFNELHRYSRLLHALTSAEERRGYSMISLALHGGSGRTGAYALSLVLAAVGAWFCLAVGRRGREVSALALALSVSLLATPIVQLHYFALLLVPFALAHPRLGPAWALPLSLWLCASPDRSWQIALALGIAAAMVLASASGDSPHPVTGREPGATAHRAREQGHAPVLV